MTFTSRLGTFVLFLVLTTITMGLYPIYFWVTRMEEQTNYLREIAANSRKG